MDKLPGTTDRAELWRAIRLPAWALWLALVFATLLLLVAAPTAVSA